jgi:EAL domain-containing protein (putative c-di-GMP-specific phosphodiesterase class I)
MERSVAGRAVQVAQVAAAGALNTVFQPIFDLESGKVAGMEALARFSDLPERPPNVWIAEAEAVGMLLDLELVLAKAALDQDAGDPVVGQSLGGGVTVVELKE